MAFGEKSAINLIADWFYVISCYSFCYSHDSFSLTLVGVGVDVFEFVLCECYGLDLKCFTRVPCVKILVPMVATLGSGEIFKRLGLVGGLEVFESRILMGIMGPPTFTLLCYKAMRVVLLGFHVLSLFTKGQKQQSQLIMVWNLQNFDPR